MDQVIMASMPAELLKVLAKLAQEHTSLAREYAKKSTPPEQKGSIVKSIDYIKNVRDLIMKTYEDGYEAGYSKRAALSKEEETEFDSKPFWLELQMGGLKSERADKNNRVYGHHI